ncbi:SAM-dependent chlorinase/fluorinase [Candidatus Roizmanbacteria bacterium]|nr:SAM-dependent chlorinase/fluorinase [Candidatus Roizmanbacteria bacterium]
MKKLITIADWGDDSLNRQEFKTVVEGYLRDPIDVNIGFISSTSSTIHTAFLVSQIIETEEQYGRVKDIILFQNTDPRLQTDEAVEKAEGAEFIIIRLKSGIFACGPNAGYDFSLIKDKIDKVYEYRGLAGGSQFRSRDMYARVCAHLMDGMEDDLDLEEGSTNIISELEGHYVGHIDNFGNIKTTITKEELKGKYEYGETIKIGINTRVRNCLKPSYSSFSP